MPLLLRTMQLIPSVHTLLIILVHTLSDIQLPASISNPFFCLLCQLLDLLGYTTVLLSVRPGRFRHFIRRRLSCLEARAGFGLESDVTSLLG
jgi:hypothetical protein